MYFIDRILQLLIISVIILQNIFICCLLFFITKYNFIINIPFTSYHSIISSSICNYNFKDYHPIE